MRVVLLAECSNRLGIPHPLCDHVWQIRELLSFYKFDGDEIPLVAGSALAAVEGRDKEVGEDAIVELMQAVDDHIPTPERGKEHSCGFLWAGRDGPETNRGPALRWIETDHWDARLEGLMSRAKRTVDRTTERVDLCLGPGVAKHGNSLQVLGAPRFGVM